MISVQTTNFLAATWSNYVLDIVIILFMAGLTILCAKRGFVECVFDFASTILSFFVAILLAKLLIFITGGLFGLEDWLGKAFAKTFIKVDGFDAVISSSGAKESLLNKNVAGVIANLAVRLFAKGKVPSGTTIARLVGDVTASLFLLLITSIILFVVAKILLHLTKKFLEKIIERITLLEAADTAIGAVLGFTQAILIVGAVLAIFAVIPSKPIDNYLSNCLFVGFMYEYNPVIAFLGLLI